jgi:hypothetical protein
VPDPVQAVRAQIERQVAHWCLAASRLDLDDLAAPEAWKGLEQYLGVSLRRHLQGVIDRLREEAAVLTSMSRSAHSPSALIGLRRQLLAFRRQFLRAETTLDYFADAIGTRTNPETAALLRACDTLAYRSMAQVLDPLGQPTPVVLSYLDKGLGAAILKAGLRLWDNGALSPVAAIKITRHNLLRPTAAIHEAGHQVAHITGWNQELAAALSSGLAGASSELANEWSSWSSEIAADAVAFVSTGFASVAALHDVLAGETASVFRHTPGDPHPICYLRVLLGVEMCRSSYGAGPWDVLAHAWTVLHSIRRAPPETRRLLEDSLRVLPTVARVTLDMPMRAFQGRPLRSVVNPERVSPRALNDMAARIGPALFTSTHWLWTECLRILALTGLQLAARPAELGDILALQEQSMLRLGGGLRAA